MRLASFRPAINNLHKPMRGLPKLPLMVRRLAQLHPGPIGQFASTKAPLAPPTVGPAVNPSALLAQPSMSVASPAQPRRPSHQFRWPGRTSHQCGRPRSSSYQHRRSRWPFAFPQLRQLNKPVRGLLKLPRGYLLSTAPTAPSASSQAAPLAPPTVGLAVSAVGPVGPAINVGCLLAQLSTQSVPLAHRIPATTPAQQANARTSDVAPDGTPLSTSSTAPLASS